jgi:hypothetical protein
MDLESLGGGAGAGLIGTILGILGINRRVSKIEKDKQDKVVCDALHKSADDKFNVLIKGQEKLFDKLDNLNVYLRNHK